MNRNQRPGYTQRLPRRAILRGAAGSAAFFGLGGTLFRPLPGLARGSGLQRASQANPSGDTGSTITQFHYDQYRSGWRPAPLTLSGFHKQGSVDFGSAVRAQPLILEGWQPVKGPLAGQTADLLFACAAADTVYCYDAAGLLAGKTTPIWTQPLGMATNRNGGYLYPEAGIQSTPVIDPQAREMYVVVMQNDGLGTFEDPHASYFFYVLDVDSGAILRSAQLVDAGADGRPTFDGNAQNQRGALTLYNGRIWAGFSDFLEADEGDFYGWLVGISLANPTDQLFWCDSPRTVGGGIWGQGGVILRSDGSFYVSTGNQANDVPDYWNALGNTYHPPDVGDYFMAILHVNAGPAGISVTDWFMPADSRVSGAQDYDLTSGSPLLLENVGGRNLIVHCAKEGIVRLLDADHLGGWGGGLAQYPVFAGGPEAGSRGAPAHLRTPDGVDWVFIVGMGEPSIIAYTVQGGAKPGLTEMWRGRPNELLFGNAPGSVMITGPAGAATLWVVNEGYDPATGDDNVVPALYGIDASTGHVIYDSTQAAGDDLGKAPHFAPTTPYADSLFVGTWTGFSWYGAA
jgi:hypothetical protein